MKLLGWINGAGVLAIILGLTGASCATQKSTVLIKDRELSHRQPAETLATMETATKAKVQAAYGKLPLSFEANQGQSDPQVKFLSRGNSYTLFLTPTEAVLALRKLHKNSLTPVSDSPTPPQLQKNSLAPVSGERARVRRLDPEQTGQPTEQIVLRMKLLEANPNPQVVGLDELPGKSNYFIGNDPKNWHTNVPTYTRVQYRDIYPGIDLIYYGNQGQLEYDFVVAPSANPKVIRLAFEGAEKLEIDAQGDLILHTAGGEVRLLKPRIYQEINGVKQPIPGGYVLLSPQSSVLITFQVAAYDASRPLLIDPVLSYSTYLGGSGEEILYDGSIAVDAAGNAYVAGDTLSTDFPTASPLQATKGGNRDAFVAKLNSTGSALVYSTYLGGSDDEISYGIAVDSSGNAYVTGLTTSTNFPTASSLQAAHSGGVQDVFVTKLNPAGSTLVYSTYLGGSGGDIGHGIAVDSFGNAYVTGPTTSTNFPTVSPLQAADAGLIDIFVTKLNPTGSTLVYSTYLGGSDSDVGRDIAIDSSGNAYVTGWTFSTNFPTVSPLQAANTGVLDIFVTKLSSTGSTLVYSTYLGGSGYDYGWAIAVDSSGNAYVTGLTGSTNFPTASPFQATHGGGTCYFGDSFPCDAVVTKLNAAGSTLIYSTYLGGSGSDEGYGIAVDSLGSAYVTGFTTSINFPTASPLQATCGSCISYADVFVTKLNPTGSTLVYSTYLGGSSADFGLGIAEDDSGSTYVTGGTTSANFPTANPFQAIFGGVRDAFVAKIVDEINNPPYTPSNPDPVDGATGVSITPTLSWSGGDPDPEDTVTYDVYFGTSPSPQVINLPDVHFDFGEASLSSEALMIVQDIAEILSSDDYAYNQVAVEGHTDSLEGDPQQLSKERAQNVADALVDYGISEERIAVRGYGERYPIAPNTNPDGSDNPEGRAKNRRVEVVLESVAVSGLTTTSYSPGTVSPSTTYYWQVTAKDNHGAETIGPVWSFTTVSVINQVTFIRPMDDWDPNGYQFGDDWPFNRCGGLLYKHAGVDVNVGVTSVGKSVKASTSGVVKEVCSHPVWKYALVLEHDMDGDPDTADDRVTTVYWHIDPVLSIDLPTQKGCFPANPEVSVEQGEQIAIVANMGSLSHLHFGLRWAPYELNLSDKGALPPVECKDLPAFPEAFVDPLDYLE